MRNLLYFLILHAFLYASCTESDNFKLVVNLTGNNNVDNPIIKPGLAYFDNKFSKEIPTWLKVQNHNLKEIKIAQIRYIKNSNNPSIIWGKNNEGENRFYFVQDSNQTISPIKFDLCKWQNLDAFCGLVDIDINHTDSLGNSSSLSFPFKLRIKPTQDKMDCWPIDYRLGKFKSDNQITDIALVHSMAWNPIYSKSTTQILVDRNQDGVFTI